MALKPKTQAEIDALREARLRHATQQAALTPEQRYAEQRREDARHSANAAFTNEKREEDALDRADAAVAGGTYATLEQVRESQSKQHGLMGNLIRDPLTMGILAAPLAITGAGLALAPAAAAGFGGGTAAAAAPAVAGGTAAGTAATGTAAAGTAAAGTAATGTAAAGTAATGTAAAGTAAAATPSLLSSIGSGLSTVAAAGQIGALAYDAFRGKTGAEKQLLAKQEQIANEAKQRHRVAGQARMNTLGQQLLAMNPQNKMMAQMFGPEAAFTPEQFAQMGANPLPRPEEKNAVRDNFGNPVNAETARQEAESKADIAAYDQGEARRREAMMRGITPVSPGQAAFQMRAPAPARRY